ncbi:MAG: hypothetical protein HY303_19485 [Candidatus Wallbacteria bacterium]|nr:hypothetical protein [Candidatus Wallbacteria bacterium]
MANTHSRFALLLVTLGFSTLLQGCFPLGLLGLAGSYGIVKTADTIGQVGNATTDLINSTNQQVTLTGEQIRTTLASIDVLVQHITKDADALTGQTVESMASLTAELTKQLEGLGQLRQQIQDTIAQGGKDLSQTLASVDSMIATTKQSLDAVTSLLRLLGGGVGKLTGQSARVRPASSDEIVSAANAYLATRGLKPEAPDSAASEQPTTGAAPMPQFNDAAAPDRS